MSACILESWHEILSQYSGTELTFGKDKLSDISAVARRCHALMGYLTDAGRNSDYLSGLWREDIEHQLLWRGIGE